MHIRKALTHEIPMVVSMGHLAYEKATGKTDFNDAVSAGNWVCLTQSGDGVVFIVASDGEAPKGFICGYISRDIDTGKRVAQMWHWVVEPEASGYGGYLLNRFESWAKEKDCNEINIGCTSQLWDNRHRAFYDRKGYKLDGLIFNKDLS